MKKETTNTFEGGMIKDLHPLTTPNNVLTDALNATFITYNGNESILQNDMGNVEIKHALLKAGYVPVGMKEYGGIIYVAAYNPQTGKGQVGSFPSPQQLWESENWTVNAPKNIIPTVTIPTIFYEGSFIINEIVKQELFKSQDREPRIFHPGDKYIIKFSSKSSIAPYINNDYMDIQLGVIKSDGGIDIMKTWDKDNSGDFLYGGNADPSTLLSDPTVVQIFDASSSGEMILIFNLHTLDSFNLLREYSLAGENIRVTFKGEGQKDGVTYTSNGSDGKLRLTEGQIVNNNVSITASDQTSVSIEGKTGKTKLVIYPNVPFGIIKRMGRTMTVDFDKIRKNQDEFSEWRFFVTDTYMKIGWAYDFYNLDGSKEIDYIRMYFHKLENGYTSTKEDLPHIDIQRESYNGNFEDYIDYKQIGLQYKNIYITEIVKKFKNEENEEIIGFKMLYLSKLYNEQYNGFYENKAIGLSGEDGDTQERKPEYTSLTLENVNINLKSESDITISESKTKVQKPGEGALGHEVNTSDVDSTLYINELNAEQLESLTNKYYLTEVHNKYNVKLKLKGEVEDYNEEIIGVPRTDLIPSIMSYCSLNGNPTAEYEAQWNKTSDTIVFPTIENTSSPSVMSSGTSTAQDEYFETNDIIVDDYRYIQGRASGLQTSPYESKGLTPMYSSKYASDKKSRIAPYWNKENGTLCLGGEGDESETIYHSCTLRPNGDLVLGPDAGGGNDDGGLASASYLMHDPMTNMFTGISGEDSEITFHNMHGQGECAFDDQERGFISHNVNEGGNNIRYQSGDYLIACWKFVDGTTHLVNLMSRRTQDKPDASMKWPRLDVMLRCILSQLFTVNRVTKNAEYITTDEKFYQYEYGKSKLKVRLSLNPSQFNLIKNDIMASTEDTTKPLTEYLTDVGKWNYHDGALHIGGKSYPMVNLIPKVQASVPEIDDDIEVELPEFDLDVLLQYYFGVQYTQKQEDDLDVKAIYAIDTEAYTDNASICEDKNGNYPKCRADGTYNWSGTPKCVPITESNSTFRMHRWDNPASIVTFPRFYSHFMTKAKRDDWTDIPDGEENEILADAPINYSFDSNAEQAYGYWTNANVEDAPDLYIKTLYSPQISALWDIPGKSANWNP